MINQRPNGIMLSLPFPESILMPNRKAHWAKKHKAVINLREACFYIVRERWLELDPEKQYTVKLTFCPPDNRQRDRDNLLAAYKAGLDGMCLALRINDANIHPIPEIGPVVHPQGKVEVSIIELRVDLDIDA